MKKSPLKIYHNFKIEAPPQKVFEAISTINGLKSWWKKDTSRNAMADGELHFIFGNNQYDVMKVTAFEKDKTIEWEITESTYPECRLWDGSKISFVLLEQEDKSTVLKFQHYNFPDGYEFCGVCNYNWSVAMQSIKSFCETGKENPL